MKKPYALLSIAGGLLLWEFVGRISSPLVFVPVSAIADAFMALVEDGELQRHALTSLVELVLGFGLAAGVGVALGIAMSGSRSLRGLLEPWLNALYATPIVALTPVLIIMFGIDIWSKVAIVFLSAVFPIWVNTAAGISAADTVLIDVARSFDARPRQVLTKVLLPSALPFIVAGFRLSVGRGIVGVVVGELFAARAGLGYLIVTSSQVFATAQVYVGVTVLAVAGILATEILKWAERRLAPWRAAAIANR